MSRVSVRAFLLVLSFLPSVLFAQSFFDRADDFFKTYVQDGCVDYARIQKNPALLDKLVIEIETHDLSNKRVTPNYLKAFYLNAYNLLVIRQVVDRYPIASPMDVEGFFDQIAHSVMGTKLTLNQLEKETLYRQFPDVRLHFALVCAARGCPPLADFAFRPGGLDEQLNQRTTLALNLPGFVRVSKGEVQVSKIFEWYRDDFTTEGSSVVSFLNQYRTERLKPNQSIRFYAYDWSLNEP